MCARGVENGGVASTLPSARRCLIPRAGPHEGHTTPVHQSSPTDQMCSARTPSVHPVIYTSLPTYAHPHARRALAMLLTPACDSHCVAPVPPAAAGLQPPRDPSCRRCHGLRVHSTAVPVHLVDLPLEVLHWLGALPLKALGPRPLTSYGATCTRRRLSPHQGASAAPTRSSAEPIAHWTVPSCTQASSAILTRILTWTARSTARLATETTIGLGPGAWRPGAAISPRCRPQQAGASQAAAVSVEATSLLRRSRSCRDGRNRQRQGQWSSSSSSASPSLSVVTPSVLLILISFSSPHFLLLVVVLLVQAGYGACPSSSMFQPGRTAMLVLHVGLPRLG